MVLVQQSGAQVLRQERVAIRVFAADRPQGRSRGPSSSAWDSDASDRKQQGDEGRRRRQVHGVRLRRLRGQQQNNVLRELRRVGAPELRGPRQHGRQVPGLCVRTLQITWFKGRRVWPEVLCMQLEGRRAGAKQSLNLKL